MLDSLIDKAQIFFGFNPDLTGNLTSVWIWYPIRRDLESYPLKKIVGIYYLEITGLVKKKRKLILFNSSISPITLMLPFQFATFLKLSEMRK